MAVKWTEEQKKVITLRDRNILVSAAAGSGKTAVLVQRILSKIMDPLKPVDIDRVLKDNDAYHALAKADGLIFTGPTGTNVNDLTVLLIRR